MSKDIDDLIRLTEYVSRFVAMAPVTDNVRLSAYFTLFTETLVKLAGHDFDGVMRSIQRERDVLTALLQAKDRDHLESLVAFHADVTTVNGVVVKESH